MTETKPIKRFIAGSRCPKCQELDSTVTYFEKQLMVRECISCGFLEKMSEAQSDEPQTIKVTQLD